MDRNSFYNSFYNSFFFDVGRLSVIFVLFFGLPTLLIEVFKNILDLYLYHDVVWFPYFVSFRGDRFFPAAGFYTIGLVVYGVRAYRQADNRQAK